MNVHSIARKLLAGTAVAVVAATCMISAGTTSNANNGMSLFKVFSPERLVSNSRFKRLDG